MLYRFDTGSGATAFDRSAISPPLDLSFDEAQANWTATGLRLVGDTILESAGPATKIQAACTASDAITVELWITPGNETDTGPARILELGQDTSIHNVLVGQTARELNLRLVTTDTDAKGNPLRLALPDAFTAAAPMHLVYVRRADGTRSVVIDGVERVSGPDLTGDFSTWPDQPLRLGGEADLPRHWHGEYHLAAIYCRALSSAEIVPNFQAGIDQSLP